VCLAGLEGAHRRHAFRLGQHRRELGGDRGPDEQHAHPARPGQPLARRRVDDVGAEVDVRVAERLGGVQHQRHPRLPAQHGHLGRGLEQAPVAADVHQVHEGRRIGGQQPGDAVEVGAADPVHGQRLRPQPVGAQLRDVRRVLPRQAGHP
jgi:hypothetical protein